MTRSLLRNTQLVVFLLAPILTAKSQQPQDDQFDPTGIFRASALLPPDWLAAPFYRIDESVYNDGIYNSWRVYSNSGTYDVTGNERLLILLRELAAIATLESESNAQRFAEAMKGAGKQQLETAQNVLRNPVKTAKAIHCSGGCRTAFRASDRESIH